MDVPVTKSGIEQNMRMNKASGLSFFLSVSPKILFLLFCVDFTPQNARKIEKLPSKSSFFGDE
jgi:hypothetical protein